MYMCVFVWMCTHESRQLWWKWVLNPLKLVLQVAMSYAAWVLEITFKSFKRVVSAFNARSISSTAIVLLFFFFWNAKDMQSERKWSCMWYVILDRNWFQQHSMKSGFWAQPLTVNSQLTNSACRETFRLSEQKKLCLQYVQGIRWESFKIQLWPYIECSHTHIYSI